VNTKSKVFDPKNLEKTMRDKYKIKVFDFIMTISTWEFIYEVIRMEWFGSFSKSFKKKISHFNGKTNEER
jgi:predicted small integral membrane protein